MFEENLNEGGKVLYGLTFNDRIAHKEEFVEYVQGYIMSFFEIFHFSEDRIYELYNTFQEHTLNEVKDGDVVLLKEEGKKVGEMKVQGKEVLVKVKAGKKWVEVKVDLEMLKFANWSLYTSKVTEGKND